jgi:hypothetical protein
MPRAGTLNHVRPSKYMKGRRALQLYTRIFPAREKTNMSNFTRGLSNPALDSLHRLTEQSGQNWWKDLLTLWRPSGSVAERNGLRLAIRDNYLNFYSRGQSVALVRFTPAGEAYVETHVKYVFGPEEKTQDCARLEGTTIRHPKSEAQLSYKGESTLHEWIERAAKYTGTEKRFVDELVAANPAIIDLEIGLPGTDERKTAPRMDCVALDQKGDGIHIVFWEAKMIDNPGLRARLEPEIVKQVKLYRDYLDNSERALSVQKSYRNVCDVLLKIRAMAASTGKEVKLDGLIEAAAVEGANLMVDLEPLVVIFGGKENQKKGNWPFHEEKLWKSHGIRNLVFEEGPYTLREPAMKT